VLPIHTILHPTDFSERSDYAFSLACALARDYSARLLVLHVAVLPAVVYGEGVALPDLENYDEKLKEKIHRLLVSDLRIRVDQRMREGDPATEILAEAEQGDVDLIVMGTHGRTGLARLLMGSVAEQVARRSPCPVLTVRHPFPESEPAPKPSPEPAPA
jgi:nucleotide-binding universal stress UspA family protein